MKFAEVIGNKDVKHGLIQAVRNGRVPHAQLIASREGGGNLAMALAYVQYLFCTNRGDEDSCGECNACKKVQNLAHPDLMFTISIAKADKVKTSSDSYIAPFREAVIENPYLSVSEWMEAAKLTGKKPTIYAEQCNEIIGKMSMTPYEADTKVMIVWLAETLYHAAVPKLLKIVEEPPAKSIFLFVSNKPEDILATILSRTQLIKLKKISEFEMLEALIDPFNLEMEKAKEVVSLADGDFNLAKKLASEPEDTAYNYQFRQMINAAYANNVEYIFTESANIAGFTKDKLIGFFNYSVRMLRECLIYSAGIQELNNLSANEKDLVMRFAGKINPVILAQIADLFEKGVYQIGRNANVKILVSHIIMKIAEIIRLQK